jgi:hypothetical protein
MKIQASAGRDCSFDLRTRCHSLRLAARTDEEMRWLAMLYRLLTGQTDGLPCLPGTHKWKGQRAGGPPDEAGSDEWVCFCEVCGWEQQGDEK